MKKIYFFFIATLLMYSCVQQKANRAEATEKSIKTAATDTSKYGMLPRLTDSALFDEVQRRSIDFFMQGAEPVSGCAPERIHTDNDYPEKDQNIVASGGTGFGVMSILVGIERKFITQKEGFDQLQKIVSFLEKADRFHGAWPHWWNGETGKVKPFSKHDDGADLVETSFLMQGLLCVRQYYRSGNAEEKKLAARIDTLWRQIEFDWFRNGNQDVLYWHWSPNYAWKMNFPVEGYNECLIMYILAASSPTHSISAEVYHKGWAGNGKIKKISSYGGDTLRLAYAGNPPQGGPLFWGHYSYLGLDPRGLKDAYADYWKENTALARINYKWCVNNPMGFKGYGPSNWGLTSSYSVNFYAGHAPNKENDRGVISPTAALSSFAYTPKESMAAMRFWYDSLGSKIFGPYGFYDAFSIQENWYPLKYLSIDQGPVAVMMENYRSGFTWKLFMSCPEIQAGLKKLGFEATGQ